VTFFSRGGRTTTFVALIALLSACSGGHAASQPTTPAGQKVVSGGGISLDVPQAWMPITPLPTPQTILYVGSPEMGYGKSLRAVFVTKSQSALPDALAVSMIEATEVLGSIPGAKQLSRTSTPVQGAGTGYVTALSFPLAGAAVGTLYDLAFLKGKEQYVVRVTTQLPTGGQELADAVFASLRLGGST
jgi:hypothetical protein